MLDSTKSMHRCGGYWAAPVAPSVQLLRARKDAVWQGVMPPLRPGAPVEKQVKEAPTGPHADMGIKNRWHPPTLPGRTLLEPIRDTE